MAERDDRPHVLGGDVNGHLHDGLFDAVDVLGRGELGRVLHAQHRAVGFVDVVDDAGGGGDEVEIELPLQPLLDDLHVEEAEKPAAKPEPERLRRVGLEGERGVVHVQLLEGVAQRGVVGAVGGEDPREHHRLHVSEPGRGGRSLGWPRG